MFERFSEPARQAFVVAHEEARALGGGILGTEHVLLGLLADDSSVAGRAFASLRVTRREVRERIVLLGARAPAEAAGARDAPVMPAVTFSDSAKRLLELSVREALRRASTRIGTGHIALGMFAVRDSTAARLLEELGVDADTGQARVLEALAEGPEPRSTPAASAGRSLQLTPETREFLRAAGRMGSTLGAGRLVPPNVMRVATVTTRIARNLNARAGTPLTPAACSRCGTPSPACGTLYAGPLGALVCERCATGSGTGDRA